MKKLVVFVTIFICSIGLCACEFSAEDLSNNIGNTFDGYANNFGNALGEQVNEVTDEIGDRIDEKVSKTLDQAKEDMAEKAEDSLAYGFSEIRDGIVENIDIQMDKLVEYKPGIWFEDASVVTYEKQGIKMNAFWEADGDSNNLEIVNESIFSILPDEAIVTFSFFENLPETVMLRSKYSKEVIELSEMENPLTGKSTYSFLVIFKEQEIQEYTLLCQFKDLEDGLFQLTFQQE